MADEDDMAKAMAEEAAEGATEEKATEKVAAEAVAEFQAEADVADMDAVYNIPVEVIAVLGTATMQVNQVLKLGRGAVVELDRLVGEEIELYAHKQLVARGEVVVIEDRLGVTITEIIRSR